MTVMVDRALAAWQPATGRPLEIGPRARRSTSIVGRGWSSDVSNRWHVAAIPDAD